MKFKEGDIVDWGGLKGTVTSCGYGDEHSLEVDFGKEWGKIYFTDDGKYRSRYPESSLKLLERARDAK